MVEEVGLDRRKRMAYGLRDGRITCLVRMRAGVMGNGGV